MRDLVPVIDLTPWRLGDADARATVAAEVDEGCRRVGFLQIVGHGLPRSIIEAMQSATAEFFALPMADKLAAQPTDLATNRGYAAKGTESLTYSLGVERPPDLFEAFNIGPDSPDLDDPMVLAERHRFFAPNIWPESVPTLRPALVAYFAAAADVARTLTDVFAAALGLPDRFFEPFTTHSTDTLRVNHYERLAAEAVPVDGQMRMGAHTDYGIVTVLYADSVPGLQIVGPDGEWHDVVPSPDALVVNLGDLTAQWTNDRWRSTIHRVVPPPPDDDGVARRRSVAFFHDGNHDAVIECLPTCTNADNPPKYGSVTAGEHLMSKLMGPRLLTASTGVDTAGDRLGAVTEQ